MIEIYLKWMIAGFPIFAVNYVVYLVVKRLTKNHHLAYWSWILMSPTTYHIWKLFEGL